MWIAYTRNKVRKASEYVAITDESVKTVFYNLKKPLRVSQAPVLSFMLNRYVLMLLMCTNNCKYAVLLKLVV